MEGGIVDDLVTGVPRVEYFLILRLRKSTPHILRMRVEYFLILLILRLFQLRV